MLLIYVSIIEKWYLFINTGKQDMVSIILQYITQWFKVCVVNRNGCGLVALSWSVCCLVTSMISVLRATQLCAPYGFDSRWFITVMYKKQST